MRAKKILDMEGLKRLREDRPSALLVHCHGVFDVLHAGHLAYFESAKKFGEVLVITITADEFVNKGPGRPYFNSAVRANMIAALEIVDFVAISRAATAVPVLETLRPNFYVKGPDYKNKALDATGGIYAEEAAVEKGGGRLVFTDDDTHSSSTLINKFFNQWTEDQVKAIDAVNGAGGFAEVEKALEALSKQDVCVIGEPIVDTYRFCSPNSISSKSPSISASYLYEENYLGGSLAIANHLAGLAKSVTLLITHGGEPYFLELLREKLDPRIKLVEQSLLNIPTPRKTRYIAVDKAQRIFEITHLRSDQWLRHSPKEFSKLIQKTNSKKNTTILADFGHGLFENSVLEAVDALDGFVTVNVQTNSSNLGFNPYTKHKRFAYLSIDTKEAQIAYHDRFSSPRDLARRLREDLTRVGTAFSMTLGSNGSYYFPNRGREELHVAAFADNVVDATGAGDAFFGLTSLLVKSGCPDILVPFLGNVFAGLKTRIIGNKSSVSRAQLVKAVTSILK
ncbi:MAG: adenylyltransferase/cytidyltransferase family protein [Deltaproteobacteria bacterium]|nr:adenylyltransferase/cytidyltransferase family protein [Deltaproteobacteria bacterium]